jgi:hypothetical protein
LINIRIQIVRKKEKTKMLDSHLTAIAALATGRTRGRREVGLVSLKANNNLT